MSDKEKEQPQINLPKDAPTIVNTPVFESTLKTLINTPPDKNKSKNK